MSPPEIFDRAEIHAFRAVICGILDRLYLGRRRVCSLRPL
jgi:hypothetical protein